MASLQPKASPRSINAGMGSQDFDFSMGGLASTSDGLLLSVGVACADELFYKGQLLPLEGYSRMSSKEEGPGRTRGGGLGKEEEEVDGEEEVLVMEKDVDRWRFVLPSPSLYPHPPPCIREGDAKFNSCRIDGGELRSSSFRSSNCGFWESTGEKESSSSSRDSNGSSQDSCTSSSSFSPSRRDHPHTIHGASCTSMHSGSSQSVHGASCHSTSLYSIHGASRMRSKPNSVRWKSLLSGLRRAWVSSTHTNNHGKTKHPVCRVGFSEDLTKYRTHDLTLQQGNFKTVNHKAEKLFSEGCNHSENKDTVLSFEGKEEEEEEGERKKLGLKAGYLRERWRVCTRKLKPLYGIVSSEAEGSSNSMLATCSTTHNNGGRFFGQLRGIEESCGRKTCAVEGSSIMVQKSKCMKKPLPSQISSCTDKACSAGANNNVKAPASKTVKPLPAVSRSGSSTMHELHSALQSAIAHCKESGGIQT